MARYYDRNIHIFLVVKTDATLALMSVKHLAGRTVLMSVHIANKDSGK